MHTNPGKAAMCGFSVIKSKPKAGSHSPDCEDIFQAVNKIAALTIGVI
jgi:hypothetical protein